MQRLPDLTLSARYKITVFVPPTFLDQLLDRIFKVTSLTFGSYDHVLWRSYPGVEQFRPLRNARPTVGKVGEISEQQSVQLVFTVPRDERFLSELLDALVQAHPWEQPVIIVEEALAVVEE